MTEIRDVMIRSHVTALFTALGRKHLPIDESLLRELHKKKDYIGMARLIQEQMLLTLRLRVGFVNKGGPKDAVAWRYTHNGSLPIYGTEAYKRSLTTICIRKNFLTEASFESVVYAIVHELSHVLLESLQSPLHENEEAVDLTTLVLGYGSFVAIGKKHEPVTNADAQVPNDASFLGRVQSYYATLRERFAPKKVEPPKVRKRSLGYLTLHEIQYAEKIIAAMR